MALADMLGLGLEAGSTILNVGAQLAKGNYARTVAARRQAAGEYEAKQLEAEAGQSVGVGMRAAQDETLKTLYANSKAMALVGASGAGASDPTVMNVIARTAGEGAYRSAVAMYEGEAQARLDRMKAAALRYQGQVGAEDAASAYRMSRTGALATAFTGGVKGLSMYEKYWAGPKPDVAGSGPVASLSYGGGIRDAGITDFGDTA